MAQKFLSVRQCDYEKCRSGKRVPYLKLHGSLFQDRDFMRLPIPARYLYIGLLMLAMDTNNSIYNDHTYLIQRLYIPYTEFDLKPLYRSGFLTTSNLSRELHALETSSPSLDSPSSLPPSSLNSPNSLKTSEQGVGHTSKLEIPLPDDWDPKDYHLRFAQARNLDLKLEAAHFRGRALELEWRTKDWDRKFSNWMLQEVKFHQRSKR